MENAIKHQDPLKVLAMFKPAPKRVCKDWLATFREYVSTTEAPEDMITWTGISTIAGMLGRRVWFKENTFTWYPNFYIIFIAPPGIVQKTTTINIGKGLLFEAGGVNFGPDIITWQSLVAKMVETRQGLLDHENGQVDEASAISIFAGELGNFLNPKDREMINALTQLWDCPATFEKNTKMSGNDSIINPCVNLIGCATPSWVADSMPEYVAGGGFMSRSIFVYAEKKARLIAYPSRQVINGSREHLRHDLVNDLQAIAHLYGEMKPTEEAYLWGEEWYSKCWNVEVEAAKEKGNACLIHYYSRKQTQLHKIAMILAISESNTRVIELRHFQKAEILLKKAEEYLLIVSENIDNAPGAKIQTMIVNQMKLQKQMKKEELYHKLFHQATKAEFDTAVNSAIFAGYLTMQQKGGAIVLKYKG